MSIIVPRRSLVLSSQKRREVIAPLDIPALTSRVEIRIARPTTLDALVWGKADTMNVTAVLELDGQEEYRFIGRTTGGVRKDEKGEDVPFYRLGFSPTYGFFGERGAQALTRRLGELSELFYRLRIEIDALAGIADTDIEVLLEEFAAPRQTFRSSVAFDAATSALESGGDGVLSLSHTATGDNRAAFVGTVVHALSAGENEASTYAGSATTELWDALGNAGSDIWHSGNYIVAPATSAQTVTTDHGSSEPLYQSLGVVSLTGVDQSSPVGAPNTATGTTSTDITVTVADVVADGMLVDQMYSQDISAPTIGANQTLRNDENPQSFLFFRQSTQSSNDGGVMSWTGGGPDYWMIGGVEFKPAGDAAVSKLHRLALLGVG